MRYLTKTFAILVLASTVAVAQNPDRGGRGRRPPTRDSMAAGQGMMAARQAIERLIRTQVQPTDEQMARLRQIDAQMVGRRTDLDREEMGVRRELRQAMVDTANVDQARIARLLDQLVGFPARRAVILQDEQKELSAVLTPVQRAKYHAIQEQLRRRIEAGRGGPPPAAAHSRPPAK